jgi:hypothetical protein
VVAVSLKNVVRNLPAQDAIDLGASVLICSDVSDPLIPADSIATALQTMTQVMLFEGDRSNEEQRALCDVTLRMQFARGTGMEFTQAPRLIAFGDSAARASIDDILAATRGSSPARSGFEPLPDAVNVSTMSAFLDGRPDASALGEGLGLDLPDSLTALDLDGVLSKAYGTGRFRFVHYRTDSIAADASRGDRSLVLQAERADRARLGFGLRYESTYKASLLLTGLFHGLGSPTSDLRLDLRLGQQIRMAADYLYRATPGTAFAAGGKIGFTRMPVDVFDDGQTVAELRFDSYTIDGFAGVAFGPRANLAFRVHGEHLLGKTAIAAEPADSTSTFYTLGGGFKANWYDREYFPMRGAAIVAKSEFASTAIGSGATFSHHVVDLHGHLPLHRRVSVMARATVGGSSGEGLPLNYLFMLGGANPQFIWPDRQLPFFGTEGPSRTAVLRGRAGRAHQSVVRSARVEHRNDLSGVGVRSRSVPQRIWRHVGSGNPLRGHRAAGRRSGFHGSADLPGRFWLAVLTAHGDARRVAPFACGSSWQPWLAWLLGLRTSTRYAPRM